MKTQFLTFAQLIYPFVLSALLLMFVPFFKIKGEVNIPIKMFGIDFKIPVYNTIILRFVWFIVALFLLCIPAFRDYAKYFPTHYEMEIFFDNEGIVRSTRQFKLSELEVFNIPRDWYVKKAQYFEHLGREIRRNENIKGFFNQSVSSVYGDGEIKILTEKLVGWQKYHIKEGAATMALYAEAPGGEKKHFLSKYNLQKTGSNYIDFGFTDIYYRFSVQFAPEFSRADKASAGGKELEYNTLIAATKIRFFPIVKISDSVIFVRTRDRKSFIPIGYAIYRPQ
ncbi:MAG: hypothetical protein ACYTA5_25390 [Planctomycetota bacterium]|jgi:hypothetical protein